MGHRGSRWLLFTLPLVTAVALLAVVGLASRSLLQASQVVEEKEGRLFYEAIRHHFRPPWTPPARNALQVAFDELRAEGLRYAALYDQHGRKLLELGEPAGPAVLPLPAFARRREQIRKRNQDLTIDFFLPVSWTN